MISACRSLEAPLRVVFFGAPATHSHLAAKESLAHRPSFADGEHPGSFSGSRPRSGVAVGVVPIENSTEGVVAHTLDCLVDSELKICGEVFLDIHHTLLSQSGRGPKTSGASSLIRRRWRNAAPGSTATFPKIAVEEVREHGSRSDRRQ